MNKSRKSLSEFLGEEETKFLTSIYDSSHLSPFGNFFQRRLCLKVGRIYGYFLSSIVCWKTPTIPGSRLSLKALELLGISCGLFIERTEVTIG